MIKVYFIVPKWDEFMFGLDLHLHQNNIYTSGHQSGNSFDLIDAQETNADIYIVTTEQTPYGFEEFEAIETVQAVLPDVKIVAFSAKQDNDIANKAEQMKLSGYCFRKTSKLDTIVDCINAASKGTPSYYRQ